MQATSLLSPDEAAYVQERAAALEKVSARQAQDALGYQLYALLFALGAALLLAWVFWPRRRVLSWRGWREESAGLGPARGLTGWRLERGRLGVAGGILLCVLCAVSHQLTVDRHRGFIADLPERLEKEIRRAARAGPKERENILSSRYLYLPKGAALRYFSLGNEAAAADYMWLTSLQYVASPFRQGVRFDLLYRFYDVILDLDPHWTEIHAQAGRVLSALDPNRRRAERFFIRAIARNPDDYTIPLEAGLHYVVPPGNPELVAEYADKAGFYLRKALSRPSLPPEKRGPLEHTIALLEGEAGRQQAAAEHLWAVARDPNQAKSVRDAVSFQWLRAESLLRVQEFSALVKHYRERRQAAPPSLEEARRFFLATAAESQTAPRWLLQAKAGALWLDAFGMPILYDARTGEVSSQGVLALRARQVQSVIENLMAEFDRQHRRLPRDLRELTDFVRQLYSPANPAPFPVLEALGNDLDCARSPLGGQWPYDPATGRIRLPAYCDPRELQRNGRYALDGLIPPYFR